MNAQTLTIGERLIKDRIEAERHTARVLGSWLVVALVVLIWIV